MLRRIICIVFGISAIAPSLVMGLFAIAFFGEYHWGINGTIGVVALTMFLLGFRLCLGGGLHEVRITETGGSDRALPGQHLETGDCTEAVKRIDRSARSALVGGFAFACFLFTAILFGVLLALPLWKSNLDIFGLHAVFVILGLVDCSVLLAILATVLGIWSRKSVAGKIAGTGGLVVLVGHAVFWSSYTGG